jgi:hypothetical protein
VHPAAALGGDLIFKVGPADAGQFQVVHGAADVQVVAVAGVRIDHKGKLHAGGQVAGVLGLLGAGDHADVGHAQNAGGGGLAAHVAAVEAAGGLGYPGGDPVKGAAKKGHPVLIEHVFLECRSFFFNRHMDRSSLLRIGC